MLGEAGAERDVRLVLSKPLARMDADFFPIPYMGLGSFHLNTIGFEYDSCVVSVVTRPFVT